MASNSNIQILTNPHALYEIVEYPKTASTAVAVGDLLEDDGSAAAHIVDSASNVVFIGVAVTASKTADTGPVMVMIKGVIKAKVLSTYKGKTEFGKAFAWSAGANGTAWQFTGTVTEGVIWALEKIAAGSYGKFLVDTLAIDAGIFQAVTT